MLRQQWSSSPWLLRRGIKRQSPQLRQAQALPSIRRQSTFKLKRTGHGYGRVNLQWPIVEFKPTSKAQYSTEDEGPRRNQSQPRQAIERNLDNQNTSRESKRASRSSANGGLKYRSPRRPISVNKSIENPTASKPASTTLEDKGFGSISPVYEFGAENEFASTSASKAASSYTRHVMSEALQSQSTGADAKSAITKKSRTSLLPESRMDQSTRADVAPDHLDRPQETNSGKSLLEALFPEEAAKQRPSMESSRSKRYIPLLPVEPIQFPPIEPTSPPDVNQSDSIQLKSSRYSLENREEVVLRFYGSSRYLNESDFRRVIPGGQHIEGWQQDLGNIERSKPSQIRREQFY